MKFLKELTEAQLKSSFNFPEPEELKAYLQKKFDGDIILKWTGKRTVTVILPRYGIPEIIDDAANRALRAFGLEYEDLTPGKPDAGGKTNKFSIWDPELKRGQPQLSKKEYARQRKTKPDNLLSDESWKKSLVSQPGIRNIINSLRKPNVQTN